MEQGGNRGQSLVNVTLYIEGGGDGQALDGPFRGAWSTFFKNAGLSGRMPRIVRGGGRRATFDKFATATRLSPPDRLPVLLVDSEGPLDDQSTVWQHLMKDPDNWEAPSESAPAFLMVQAMEAWIAADQIGRAHD